MAARLRARMRQRFFEFLRRVARTHDARAILARGALGGRWIPRRCLSFLIKKLVESPYPETERFRSGSTLLWNIFRNRKGKTAYYEPFNERRWFDPEARSSRVDATHRGVSDYWREYDGLGELAQH